jgi:opacity protein-like surface antigen
MTFKKTQTCCAITAATLTMAGALVSPQALAGSTKADRIAEATNSKVDALEAQLQAMQAELESLKAAQGAPGADAQKVQELDQWMQQVKSAPVEEERHHDNTLSFRGGFAHMDNARNGVSIQSDVVPLGAQDQSDTDGWYIGAGFDFNLTHDIWGLMDNTEVLAELMFEYKEFASAVAGNGIAQDPTILAGVGGVPREVTVNQFTLTAAPKIKFLEGSALRPWIIPFGLGLHVISPPSESITVLNPGMMFGAGADYRVWKDIFIGVDGRYHLTGGAADGVNTDGFTAGGYIGIGF